MVETKVVNFSILDRIMAYESGEMSSDDVVEFFQDLASTGVLWSLQGHYQRTYTHLMTQGLL